MEVESPDKFLEGWSDLEHNTLPPSFHAYALRLYAAYLKARQEKWCPVCDAKWKADFGDGG